MQRFLNIYWVIYLAVYVVAVGFLIWWYWGELRRGDGLTRVYLLAAIFGTAAGGASVFALILEGGGRLVLLIPAAVKKIRDAGREEGVAIGREQGREEGLAEGIEIGRDEGLGEGIEIGIAQGAERNRAEMGQRRAEALERFGRYDANGEFVLPFTEEVERFLDGEDVEPDKPNNHRNRRPR